ncbi:MAG TPA: branched-chain amino acid ABC transporter permease [Mycobacteriales bacterium]|nr:branched-chain amino acid ABC transporter permease [Mycobacteriales bacterium]
MRNPIDRARWRRVPMVLRHGVPAVVGLGVLLAITEGLPAYRNTQLANIATEVCAVAGLTILTGLSGQISLGNGAFMFVGAYTVALILEHEPITHNGWLVLVLLAAVAVSAVAGGLVGIAAARLRGPYLAGITLALAVGIPVLPLYSHLQGPLGGHAGLSVNAPSPPNHMDFFRWQAWICLIAAAITLFLLANLSSSRVGRAFRAVRDDEIAASLAGLPVARVQILAFVVSAACAGLAGGLFAIVAGGVGPASFSLSISLGLLAAAVFGGLGTLSGAVYGSIIVTLLPTWSGDIASHVSLSDKIVNNLPQAVYGLGLIVGMLLFPLGIQGLVRRLGMIGRNALKTKPAGN